MTSMRLRSWIIACGGIYSCAVDFHLAGGSTGFAFFSRFAPRPSPQAVAGGGGRQSFFPLGSVTRPVREIVIPGFSGNNLLASATDSQGAIYVASPSQVAKFDRDGHLVRTIGTPGWSPGQFRMPWALACDQQDNLYVFDIKADRLSIFDAQGAFSSSFSLSPYGFVATSMVVAPSGDIYLAGMQRPPQDGSPLLYEISRDGHLLRSFFPQDARVGELHLGVVGSAMLAVDSKGVIYAGQPVSPEVSTFAPGGAAVGRIGAAPEYYRAPHKFPNPMPSDHSKVQALLATWTEMSDLRVLSHQGVVITTFNVHSPLPFAIELHSTKGKLLAGGVGSDLYPAFTDSLDHVYFYNPNSEELKFVETAITVKGNRPL